MLTNWRYQYANSNLLSKVIAVNLIVFLFINLSFIICKWGGITVLFENGPDMQSFKPMQWLSATANLPALLLKPWSPISAMFLHEGLWHILSNMLVLYYMGTIFCDLLGEKKFMATYIFGGLAGFALYLLCYNIFPYFSSVPNSQIYGASAAVMAVLFATASYFPNYEIRLILIGGVKLKWLALIYLAIDVLALKENSNLGGHIAHIGGALYGFAYAKNLTSKNRDWSEYFYMLGDLFKGNKKSTIKVKYRADKPVAAAATKSNQAEIDAILDKISKTGYDKLSQAEKDILFKASKEN